MMIQRYSSSVTVITRVIKSINVNKKIASRGHFIDQSILISKSIPEGDLVLIHRLKDIHNQGKVHVDVNGRGMQVRQSETMPVDLATVGQWLQRRYSCKSRDLPTILISFTIFFIFRPFFVHFSSIFRPFIHSKKTPFP